MAMFNSITPAVTAASLDAFESQARADGFLDEKGFFVGPPDELEEDPVEFESPTACPSA